MFLDHKETHLQTENEGDFCRKQMPRHLKGDQVAAAANECAGLKSTIFRFI